MSLFSDIGDSIGGLFDIGSQIDHLTDIGNAVKGYFTGETASSINTAASLKAMAQQYQYNLALQNTAQSFSSSEAKKTRDFEKSLSDTAYQRVVKDLKKAGLNPLLAATSLGGASTPVVSSATSPGGSVGIGNTGGAQPGSIGSVVSSAAALASGIGSVAKLGGELQRQSLENQNAIRHGDLLTAQTAKTAADTAKTLQDTRLPGHAAKELTGVGNVALKGIKNIAERGGSPIKRAALEGFQGTRQVFSDLINSASDYSSKVKSAVNDSLNTLRSTSFSSSKSSKSFGSIKVSESSPRQRHENRSYKAPVSRHRHR